jgi:hypothetical protein
MAHAGRPARKLQITDAERAELKARLRVRKAPEDEKLHANCAGLRRWGVGYCDCPALGHAVQTVSNWRWRYQAYRLAGSTHTLRAGRPRSADVARVQQSVYKVRQSTPDNSTDWSVRQMSRRMGVSPATDTALLACVWSEAAFA